MLSAEDFSVSRFGSPKEFKDFECEKSGYREFVQNPDEALKYQQENLGVTYVFRFKGTPLGFVTLAMSALRKQRLPAKRQDQKPFRDVPCLLLGHMARDVSRKGQGVGKIMIDWVLRKAWELGREVGCRFVILDSEPDMVDLNRMPPRAEPTRLKTGSS